MSTSHQVWSLQGRQPPRGMLPPAPMAPAQRSEVEVAHLQVKVSPQAV